VRELAVTVKHMTGRTNIDPHGTNYTRLLFRATLRLLEKEGDVSHGELTSRLREMIRSLPVEKSEFRTA